MVRDGRAAVTIEPTTKILVVDDDAETARMMRGWYKDRPFQVLDAKDGEEGVHRAVAEKPDIILMDLMMPRTNGFEASRRLRADPSTSGIPVILLSAAASRRPSARPSTPGSTITSRSHSISPRWTHVSARCSRSARRT